MRIGVFPPFGDDYDKNIAFCLDAGASCIALRPGDAPSAADLAQLKARYARAGIDACAVMAPRITTEAMLDSRLREAESAALVRLIEAMGAAGIGILHLYVSSVRAPTEPTEYEAFFQRLVAYYRRLVAAAEPAGVRLATHTYNAPSRLVWNADTLERILDAAPSPSNGVLFCTGKTELAGDDMLQTIRRYGERIVLVHVRNVAGDYVPGTYEAEDRRELEVRFDLGNTDLVQVFRTLKEIGCQAPVFAEHYPSIAGDRAAGLAWTCGYLKAIEATLGV